MGKRIDTIALYALIVFSAYAYFMLTIGIKGVAAAFSAALCLLAHVLLQTLRQKKGARGPGRRARQAWAQAEMEKWLTEDTDQALEQAASLMREVYGMRRQNAPAGFAAGALEGKLILMRLLQRASGTRADDANCVASLYRQARAQKPACLIVISTGEFDESARQWARKKRDARILLIGRAQLSALLIKARCPAHLPKQPARPRFTGRAALSRVANRKNAPRLALYGLLFLAVYLVMGAKIYLPLSLALLLLAVSGARRAAIPEKLF